MVTKSKVVKPTLEVVNFHDDFLEVVRVAANSAVGSIDNEYWVSVKKVCLNLGLKFDTQHQKLKSDPTFEARLIEVPTAGGVQKVFCIPIEKLNGWLFTINPNKVKPEVKEKLIAYKNECFKVLYNHFLKKAQPMEEVSLESISGKILGYKGQLAKANKRIKELELEIAYLKEEVDRVPHNPIDEMMRGLFGFTFDDLKKKNNKERE